MKSQYILVTYDKTKETMSFTGLNEKLQEITKPKTIKVTKRSKARQDLEILNSTDTETFTLYYPTSSRLDLQTPEVLAHRFGINPENLKTLNPQHHYALLPKKSLESKDFNHFLKMIVGLSQKSDW